MVAYKKRIGDCAYYDRKLQNLEQKMNGKSNLSWSTQLSFALLDSFCFDTRPLNL
jgi:hypothetical protein